MSEPTIIATDIVRLCTAIDALKGMKDPDMRRLVKEQKDYLMTLEHKLREEIYK